MSALIVVCLVGVSAWGMVWGIPRSDPPGMLIEEPECVVTLNDGGQMAGRLVEENESEIIIRVGQVLTRFKRENVERLVLIEPVLDRYRRMRRMISQGDTDQLLMLSEWLMGERQYALALREVEGVLELEPLNPRARELSRLLNQQVLLLENARPDGEPSEPKPRERTDREIFPVLSSEQINLIRVFEVDLAHPPKMSVSRETVERILSYYTDSELVPRNPEQRRSLFRKRADEILALLFDLRARELYPEVRIEQDPDSMRRFRIDVHGKWLLRGCATNRCHGGQEAGRLYLTNKKWRADPTVYTNFLILDRFRTDDGRPLIDYDQPDRSLLLELALPRESSAYPHPIISQLGRERTWRPVIRSRDDENFRKTLSWIRSMYKPHPDYPIDYTPPLPAGAAAMPAGPKKPGQPR